MIETDWGEERIQNKICIQEGNMIGKSKISTGKPHPPKLISNFLFCGKEVGGGREREKANENSH